MKCLLLLAFIGVAGEYIFNFYFFHLIGSSFSEQNCKVVHCGKAKSSFNLHKSDSCTFHLLSVHNALCHKLGNECFIGVPDLAMQMWPQLQKKSASLFRTVECTGNSSGPGSSKAIAKFWTLSGCSKKISLHTCFYFFPQSTLDCFS